MYSLTDNIVINKALMKEVGINPAVIYSELQKLYNESSKRGELINGEWFLCTYEQLKESTTLGRSKQDGALIKLKKHGFVESERMGMPAKRYFKLNPIETLVV